MNTVFRNNVFYVLYLLFDTHSSISQKLLSLIIQHSSSMLLKFCLVTCRYCMSKQAQYHAPQFVKH